MIYKTKKTIDVATKEYAFATEIYKLHVGLDSCVGMLVYVPNGKVALGHILLPTDSNKILEKILAEFDKQKTPIENIRAFTFGGDFSNPIGNANINASKLALEEKEIKYKNHCGFSSDLTITQTKFVNIPINSISKTIPYTSLLTAF